MAHRPNISTENKGVPPVVNREAAFSDVPTGSGLAAGLLGEPVTGHPGSSSARPTQWRLRR